jgi:hypothetical protein
MSAVGGFSPPLNSLSGRQRPHNKPNTGFTVLGFAQRRSFGLDEFIRAELLGRDKDRRGAFDRIKRNLHQPPAALALNLNLVLRPSSHELSAITAHIIVL